MFIFFRIVQWECAVYSVQPCLPLAATMGPAGQSRVFSIESGPLLDSKGLWGQLRFVLLRCCSKYFTLSNLFAMDGGVSGATIRTRTHYQCYGRLVHYSAV